jgi:hypothetical protein
MEMNEYVYVIDSKVISDSPDYNIKEIKTAIYIAAVGESCPCSMPTYLFLEEAIEHLVDELLDFADPEDLICIHVKNSPNEIFMSPRKLKDFKARMLLLDEDHYRVIRVGSPFKFNIIYIPKKTCDADHVVNTNNN